MPKPRLGISACLLGEKVRYDGEHKRDAFIVDVMGELVEWVPVCPEVEVGMGVPREPIRLVGSPESPRLVAERSGREYTAAMLEFARRRAAELEKLDLAGYVTKKDSPSCGMERVPIWPVKGGTPRRRGVGLFVRAVMERMPHLPVEEAEHLQDSRVRERFLERVSAFARLRR